MSRICRHSPSFRRSPPHLKACGTDLYLLKRLAPPVIVEHNLGEWRARRSGGRTVAKAEAANPLEELERENAQIQRLLESLLETATELKAGREVPSGRVSEGLRLLEQYSQLHVKRMDQDLQPEARPVAMSTCFDHLDQMTRDHAEDLARVETLLRRAAGSFTLIEPERGEVVGELEELTERLYTDLTHENDYPLSCLVATLPEEAAQRLAQRFTEDQHVLDDLDLHIERYLTRPSEKGARTLAVTCVYPGCNAKGEAKVRPAADGRLGLELPEGWKANAGAPRVLKEETIQVHVQFRCPLHSAP